MKYDHEITLKLGDKLKIGDDIVIILCRLGTTNTHFGCEAPRHINIVRQEAKDKRLLNII